MSTLTALTAISTPAGITNPTNDTVFAIIGNLSTQFTAPAWDGDLASLMNPSSADQRAIAAASTSRTIITAISERRKAILTAHQTATANPEWIDFSGDAGMLPDEMLKIITDLIVAGKIEANSPVVPYARGIIGAFMV